MKYGTLMRKANENILNVNRTLNLVQAIYIQLQTIDYKRIYVREIYETFNTDDDTNPICLSRLYKCIMLGLKQAQCFHMYVSYTKPARPTDVWSSNYLSLFWEISEHDTMIHMLQHYTL